MWSNIMRYWESTYFQSEDELPTRPISPEARAALLLRHWKQLSESDKRFVEAITERLLDSNHTLTSR
jgi:hypothetical protein